MKGIILAGGTGSRLYPLTKVTNKHLLPIGRKPMIFYPIEKLIEAGITDIMIVTGTDHMGDMISMLGSGTEMGCSFTFRVQDSPNGIGGALKLCRNFSGGDPVAVLLGDNIFEDSIVSYVDEFKAWIDDVNDDKKALLILKKVKDANRFGVAVIDEIRNEIIEIEEKPKKPKSNLCITGIYFYDKSVFDFIDCLKPSKRDEYEITDVNNGYIREGVVKFKIMDGWWTDAGTFSSYKKANVLVDLE